MLYRVTRRLIEWRGGYRTSNFLIRRFGGKKPLEVDVLGFRMLLDPKDRICGFLLYYPQWFDAEERAALIPQIRPEDFVVDAGAHYGFYSLLAAKRVAGVLSIEADPRTFARLRHNLALNHAENVSAVNIGISDRGERLKLYCDDALGNQSAHSFVAGRGREDAIEVDCLPLAEIMETQGFTRCDVLKIDVEGFEYRVLKPFFEQSKIRPRLILTEYYPDWNTGDVPALLKDYGYRLERKVWANYLFSRAD
ncbi:MAG: FkbM family methyltransferase [Candidatus Binataceae bacterium]